MPRKRYKPEEIVAKVTVPKEDVPRFLRAGFQRV